MRSTTTDTATPAPAAPVLSDEQQQLVAYVQRHEGRVTVRELQRSNGRRYQHNDDAEAALAALVELGLGQWVREPTDRVGGLPTLAFCLADSDAAAPVPQDAAPDSDKTLSSPTAEALEPATDTPAAEPAAEGQEQAEGADSEPTPRRSRKPRHSITSPVGRTSDLAEYEPEPSRAAEPVVWKYVKTQWAPEPIFSGPAHSHRAQPQFTTEDFEIIRDRAPGQWLPQVEAAVRKEIESLPAVKRYRDLWARVSPAVREVEALDRQRKKLLIDMEDAVSQMAGTEQARRIGDIETAIQEIDTQVQACEKGIAFMQRRTEEARQDADREVRGVVMSVMRAVGKQLRDREAAARAELATVCSDLLTELDVIANAMEAMCLGVSHYIPASVEVWLLEERLLLTKAERKALAAQPKPEPEPKPTDDHEDDDGGGFRDRMGEAMERGLRAMHRR